MLSCHDATRLMSEEQDRPLDLQERLSLGIHVAMCAGCRQFGKQMAVLRLVTRRYAARPDDDGSDSQ